MLTGTTARDALLVSRVSVRFKQTCRARIFLRIDLLDNEMPGTDYTVSEVEHRSKHPAMHGGAQMMLLNGRFLIDVQYMTPHLY